MSRLLINDVWVIHGSWRELFSCIPRTGSVSDLRSLRLSTFTLLGCVYLCFSVDSTYDVSTPGIKVFVYIVFLNWNNLSRDYRRGSFSTHLTLVFLRTLIDVLHPFFHVHVSGTTETPIPHPLSYYGEFLTLFKWHQPGSLSLPHVVRFTRDSTPVPSLEWSGTFTINPDFHIQ